MIPLPYQLLTLVLAALIAGATGAWSGYGAGAAKMQAAWTADKLERERALTRALRERAEMEAKLNEELQRQAQAHSQEVARQQAAAGAARGELERLRRALSKVARAPVRRDASPAPAVAGCAPDGAAPILRELLGECASELATMGEAAGGLAGQVTGLQQYIRTIGSSFNR